MRPVFLWATLVLFAATSASQAFGGGLVFGGQWAHYCTAPVTVVYVPVYHRVTPVYCPPSAAARNGRVCSTKPHRLKDERAAPELKHETDDTQRALTWGRSATGKDELCKVGFWNLTGRDVKVNVNGQDRVVPRDRAITLDLAREFTWKLDGQAAQVQVPADKNAHEIVLRR